MSRFLVDTNVFVYAYDAGEKDKQAIAERLLRELQPTGLAAISAQVLGEFFRVVTTRLSPPMPVREAARLIGFIAESFATWGIDDLVVLEAARGVRDHRLSYWDSQLWATSRLRGARFILTEDFADGRTLEGVTFRDPFRSGFDIGRLIAAAT